MDTPKVKPNTFAFFLRGVPSSGKSTLAKKLELSNYKFTRISVDDVGRKAWINLLKEAIEREDRYIVVDRCHSSVELRKKSLQAISFYKNRVCSILVTLPRLSFEELTERIKNDLRHKYSPEERLIGLKCHMKKRSKDTVDIIKEGWDYHLDLNTDDSLEKFLRRLDNQNM